MSKIGIAICTKDRKESLLILLNSLCKFKNHPHSITIIDDITNGQNITEHEICSTNRNIDFHYFPVKFCSITKSRNFALQHISEKIILFIDDDAEVKSDVVSRFDSDHHEQPKVCVFCPTIKSTDSRYLSLAITLLTNCGAENNSSLTERLQTPSGICFSVNINQIRKHHITFPRLLPHIGEDTVFFYKIYKNKLAIFHDPKIIIYHHYNLLSNWQTLHRYYEYGQGFKDIKKYYYKLIPYDHHWWLPERILDYLIFPIFMLKVVIKQTRHSIDCTKISPQLTFALFLLSFSYILGIYSDHNFFREFLAKLTQKFNKSLCAQVT
jgi:GT2 family glycosyltransferase